MSAADLTLALSVFLACVVEAVEALTIVLALGVTRDWHSTLLGTGTALALLGVMIVVLGPALSTLPIDALRVGVGGLLLIFGLQWLKKAIRRAAGLIPLHDESLTFARTTASARIADERGSRGERWERVDAYAFAVAFKGVLLEGLEVAFIVLTFGANRHRIGLAAAAAGVAVLVVSLLGLTVRAPLARVPENAMKFAVGVMITSFGVFWGVEGAGASWPGGDVALLAIVPTLAVVSMGIVSVLRGRRTSIQAGIPSGNLALDDVPAGGPPQGIIAPSALPPGQRLRAAAPTPVVAVGDFVLGEDWRIGAIVALALAGTAVLASAGVPAWWLSPLVVLGAIALPLGA